MKINFGCGHNKREGYVNVDAAAACAPDEVWDLETFPWPWANDSVEEALFFHSLEHMGGDPKVFLRLMQELYRVCAPDAVVKIVVPHPRHDNFIGDPTHVRPITPQMLTLFDRELNDQWQAKGQSNTPLAHYLGVDFTLTKRAMILAQPYRDQLNRGEIDQASAMEMVNKFNNVVTEIQVEMKVRKPAAG